MADDMTLDMVIDEGARCRDIVEGADFAACPPEMKRVYLFLINSSLANIKQRRAFGITHFFSGGLGAALMAAAEFYARYKGWK